MGILGLLRRSAVILLFLLPVRHTFSPRIRIPLFFGEDRRRLGQKQTTTLVASSSVSSLVSSLLEDTLAADALLDLSDHASIADHVACLRRHLPTVASAQRLAEPPSEFRIDELLAPAVLGILGRRGEPGRVMRLLQTIPAEKRSEETLLAAAMSLAKARRWAQITRQLLPMIGNVELVKSSKLLSVLASAHAIRDDWRQAVKTFKILVSQSAAGTKDADSSGKQYPDLRLSTSVISCCAKASAGGARYSTFESTVPPIPSLEPRWRAKDAVAAADFSSLAAESSSEAFAAALDVWILATAPRDRGGAGLVADTAFTNAFLTACSAAADWRFAEAILRTMTTATVAATINRATSAQQDVDATRDGTSLLHSNPKRAEKALQACVAIKPDVRSFNIALAACKNGNHEHRKYAKFTTATTATMAKKKNDAFAAALAACRIVTIMVQVVELKPSTVTFNTLAAALCGFWPSSLLVLSQLVIAPPPNCSTTKALPSRCSSAVAADAIEPWLVSNATTAPPNSDDAVVFLAVSKALQEVKKAFASSEAPYGPVKADTISFNTALAALANAGQWRISLALLNEMVEVSDRPPLTAAAAHIEPDQFSFACTIRACALAGQSAAAQRLYRGMGKTLARGRRSLPVANTVCLNAALMACARRGQFLDGVALVTETTGVVDPTFAHFASLFPQEASHRAAGDAVATASAAARPDVTSFNCLIHACAGSATEHWRDAVKLLRFIEETPNAPKPDSITYATVVAVLERAGEWERALLLLDRIRNGTHVWRRDGHHRRTSSNGEGESATDDDGNRRIIGRSHGSSTLHAVGYTAAIKACQKSGDNWRCLAMLDEMKRQHPSLPLDTATVNSVVTAAAKLGEPGKALNLLSEFAYACDVVTYNCALDACVKGGEPLKAVEVFLRLQSRFILAETQDTGGGAAIDKASSLEVRGNPKTLISKLIETGIAASDCESECPALHLYLPTPLPSAEALALSSVPTLDLITVDDVSYRILIEALDGRVAETSLRMPQTASFVYATAMVDEVSRFDPFQNRRMTEVEARAGSSTSSSSFSSSSMLTEPPISSEGWETKLTSIESLLMSASLTDLNELWLPYHGGNSPATATGNRDSSDGVDSYSSTRTAREESAAMGKDEVEYFTMIDLHHHSQAAAVAAFRYCLTRIAASVIRRLVSGKAPAVATSVESFSAAAQSMINSKQIVEQRGLLVVTGHGKQRSDTFDAKLPSAIRRVCHEGLISGGGAIPYEDIAENDGAFLIPLASLARVVSDSAKEWWEISRQEHEQAWEQSASGICIAILATRANAEANERQL